MSLYKSFRLETAEHVATLTLSRPQTMNAIGLQFMDDLAAVCAELAADTDTRAVILTATGRGFCSGLDVNLFSQVGATISIEELPTLIDRWQAAFDALANLPQITVSAINGITLGAGIELILCTDFRICSTRAVFGMPEVKLGIIPDLGGIPRLVRTVGLSWAKEIILRPRNFSAMEALRVGLINRVAEHGDLMGQARKWARQFASLPAPAAREAKLLLNGSFETDLAISHSRAKEAQLKLFASPEFRTALQAMREERAAGERVPQEEPSGEPAPAQGPSDEQT
ncbi:MAG: enoyl-CoA hydratase/isomerase family protein [Rudaea sp.]